MHLWLSTSERVLFVSSGMCLIIYSAPPSDPGCDPLLHSVGMMCDGMAHRQWMSGSLCWSDLSFQGVLDLLSPDKQANTLLPAGHNHFDTDLVVMVVCESAHGDLSSLNIQQTHARPHIHTVKKVKVHTGTFKALNRVQYNSFMSLHCSRVPSFCRDVGISRDMYMQLYSHMLHLQTNTSVCAPL